MSDELLPLLTKISGDVGEIKGSIAGIKEAFDAHVKQDQVVQAKLFERMGALEISHAQQRGSIKTWGAVATGAVGLITAGIQLLPDFIRRHHGG